MDTDLEGLEGTPGDGGRRRKGPVLAAIAAVVLVVGAALVWVVTRDRGSGEAEQRRDPSDEVATTEARSPSTTAGEPGEGDGGEDPVAGPPLAEDQAVETVQEFLAASAAVLSDPEDADVDAADVAGPALEELRAMAVQYEHERIHQEGVVEVVSASVSPVDASTDPPTAVVDACLDSSNVRLIHENGSPVLIEEGRPPRTRHLITVAWVDGGWVVYDRAFPDDPDC